MDTTGNLHFTVCCKVSLTQGIKYISSMCGTCTWAVEHNMATFSELSLAVCWEGKAKASTMSNSAESNVQLLTPAAMVANLGHQVFTKMGSLKIVTTKTNCYTE